MSTEMRQQPYDAATAGGRPARPTRREPIAEPPPRLTTEQVWREIGKSSFAVVSYVSPSGEPRSSGVMYRAVDRRLYVVVGSDSWKARHIAISGRVAVTVPVRRGGILSLMAPIPPGAISFHAAAMVHPPGSPQFGSMPKAMRSMLTPEVLASCSLIEIVPEGAFLTYGIGIPLMKMRDTDAARARAPVS